MSHRRPLALLAAILTAFAVAACGSSAATVDPASTSTDPAELLRDAAVQTAAVKSGAFEARVKADDGQSTVKGVFAKSEDAKAIPTLSVEASGSGDHGAAKAAARWVDGKGYVQWDGRWYVVDGMLAQQVQAAYEQAQADGQGSAPTLDPSRWLKGARTDGTADVAGVETVKVTGTVDGAALAEDLERAQAQSGGMGLPGGAGSAGKREKLEKALEGATADAYVGVQDRVLRRVVVTGKQGERVELTLSKVGEDVTVDAPSGARPIAELVKELGGLPGIGGAAGGWSAPARTS
jgi:hypothetical protein